jgi:hypothetical protein
MAAALIGIITDFCEIYSENLKSVLDQMACTYLINKVRESRVKKYERLWEWASAVRKYLTLGYFKYFN